MAHRGARAADGRTGDGAGILRRDAARALPARAGRSTHVRVPERHLGAVCLFLPRDADAAAATRAPKVEAAVRSRATSRRCAGASRRSTPTCSATYARRTAPSYEQLLVDMGPGNVRERMRSCAAR